MSIANSVKQAELYTVTQVNLKPKVKQPILILIVVMIWGFPGGSSGKKSTCQHGDIRYVG